jgi:glyoxylase-like metal-dependent hydrolase (beta-lactamase superfamily II)
MIKRGANRRPVNAPLQANSRRDLVMISLLVYHAQEGLFLFDCGSCEDAITSWGLQALECTPRIWDKEEHGLPAAIKATGNDIRDVKAVIVSHLHLDHAGGLEHFMNTGSLPTPLVLDFPPRFVNLHLETEIWCHEIEYKNAFWLCGTQLDPLYLPDYLVVRGLKWRTFSQDVWELFQGVTLHRCPGHTEGLCIVELQLPSGKTFIATSDLFHVKENYEDNIPQGILISELNQWHRSRQYVQNLAKRKDALVLLGHDTDYFERFTKNPDLLL